MILLYYHIQVYYAIPFVAWLTDRKPSTLALHLLEKAKIEENYQTIMIRIADKKLTVHEALLAMKGLGAEATQLAQQIGKNSYVAEEDKPRVKELHLDVLHLATQFNRLADGIEASQRKRY